MVAQRDVNMQAQADQSTSPLQSEQPVRIQGFVVTDHWLTVPLDHFNEDDDGPTIKIFAREVCAMRGANHCTG